MSATTTMPITWGGAPASVSTDPNPPRVDGQHAFVVTALFQVKRPGQADLLLDRENLYATVPPFCWWCRASTDDGTPCPGQPG